MRVFGFACMVAALSVASAPGGEEPVEVEIKIAHPQVGQRVKVTVEENRSSTVSVTGKKENRKEVETNSLSLEYVQEILEIDAKTEFPKKLKRTYQKAVLTNRKGTESVTPPLDLAGEEVTIEREKERYKFSANQFAKKKRDNTSTELLENEFNNKPSGGNLRDLIAGTKAVKGVPWNLDSEKLIAALREKEFQLDKTKVVGTGKLLSAEKREGKLYGKLEVNITAPVTQLGEKSPLNVDGTLTIKITGDGFIDGSSPQGKSLVEMTLNASGTVDGQKVTVEATMSYTYSIEPVPKK